MRRFLLTTTIGLAVLATGATAQNRPSALEDFTRRVADYVALHRQVERAVPALEMFTDPRPAQTAVREMEDAMRAARPHACEGEIFTPQASDALRRVIGTAMADRGMSTEDLMEAMTADADSMGAAPMVNERFSWALPSVMPPFMLQVLPALPPELEYRFVGRDLILIDLHPNLVVDIVRDALPQTTFR